MSKAKETKTKIKIIAGLAGVISVLAVVIFPLAAFANADPANTTAKITYTQLNNCIKDNYFAPELTVDEFTSLDVLFPNKSFSSDDARAKNQVLLPTSYGHSVSSNALSCYQLFAGTKGWTGIATNKFKNTKNKAEFLENFGYTKTTDGGGLNKCLALNYKIEGESSNRKTAEVCVHVEEKNGKYVVSTANGSSDVKVNGTEGTLFSYPDDQKALYTYVDPEQLTYGHVYIGIGLQGTAPSAGYTVNDGPYKVFHFNDGDDWNTVVSNYEKYFKENISQENFYTYNEYAETPITHLKYAAQSASTSDDGVGRTTYKYTGANANTIKKYLGIDSQFVNTYDLYSMYDHYLFDYYNLSIDNTTCRKRSEGAPTGNEIYVATSTSEINVCAITESSKLNASSKSNVRAIASGTVTLQEGGIDDIIKWNQGLSIQGEPIENAMANKELTKRGELGGDGTSGGDGTTGGSGSSSDDGTTEDDEDTAEEACYKHAGSMGWIICPIVFGMREVADNIYEWVEKFIMVDDSIVSQIGEGTTNGQGSIYTAWNTFRTLANIVFVILFLFVIFSQLTGFGIDNYGIKKMLPKLIITAVLINLSFVICAIAVDLSNVLGRAIHNFFTGFEITAQIETIDGMQTVSSDAAVAVKQVTSHIVDVALLAGGSLAVGSVLWLNRWALLIPIALFLLTFVISVVFAFIVLGLRQAAVVVLIVIAPLALSLYALPNTEKIFKKWFDAFKGVLVVYPVVGALVGGGNFAGRVLLGTSGDFLMTLISGLLFVVPYFLIPSLMRKSLSAIGDIGNRISNAGRNAGNSLRNGANNLDSVKNARADFAERNAQNRANRYFRSKRADKDAEAVKNGTASIRQSRRYKRNAGLANTQRQANVEARSAQSQYKRLQSDTGFQSALSSANMAEADTAVKNFETMISAGDYDFDYIDEKGNPQTKLNAQDNAAIEKALTQALMESDGSDEANAKVRALTNALAGKGKDGRQRMFNAVDNAQKGGASEKAIRDFATNIQNNHAGTMKDKFRPLYEFTKKAQVDGSGNISDFKYAAVDKFSTGDMANMDVTHLRDFVGNDGKFSAEFVASKDYATAAPQLTSLAQQTLADEHLSQNLSGEQRAALEAIVAAGAASSTPAPAGAAREGEELKVREAASNATTSAQMMGTQGAAIDKYVTGVNNRVKSGDIKPEEGDRMIQRAHEYVDQKNTQNGQSGNPQTS